MRTRGSRPRDLLPNSSATGRSDEEVEPDSVVGRLGESGGPTESSPGALRDQNDLVSFKVAARTAPLLSLTLASVRPGIRACLDVAPGSLLFVSDGLGVDEGWMPGLPWVARAQATAPTRIAPRRCK